MTVHYMTQYLEMTSAAQFLYTSLYPLAVHVLKGSFALDPCWRLKGVEFLLNKQFINVFIK